MYLLSQITTMKKYILTLILLAGLFKSYGQYSATNVVTSLPFPIALAIAPDGRFFVTLKGGSGASAPSNARVDIYNPSGTLAGSLWDFTDSVQINFERGVLGIALDPDFQNNHYVYVFYNHNSPAQIRVVRFTENNNQGTNPLVVFQYSDPFSAGNHTGGNIHFRASDPGKLYISLGDRAVSANSQLLTNPCGKILRINSDGSIPSDNPFYDDGNPATGNDDRIWAYGLRNSFDFTFSPLNDSLYATENGASTRDEVNLIMRGANYGWPDCEGNVGSGCSNSAYTAPLAVWNPPLPAVTAALVYDHALMPELRGHLLVANYNSGSITDLTLGNAPVYDTVTARAGFPLTFNGITDLVQGPEGCIYVVEGGYTASGRIRKVCPVDMGLGETESASFAVSPNPTAGLLTVTLQSGAWQGAFYRVMDLSGRLLLSGFLHRENQVLDLQSLPAATYLISVEKEGQQLTRKIVKN